MSPLKFDPERYSPGWEGDRKQANAYLAWGAVIILLFLLFFPRTTSMCWLVKVGIQLVLAKEFSFGI